MPDSNQTPTTPRDPVAALAGDVATDLYRAVCGLQPKAVRAYHDDDALLLLLRFDPAELEAAPIVAAGTMMETAFMAMPGMIASAVEARCGHRLVPGNISVSTERGLAVFAFNEQVAANDAGDEDFFSMDDVLSTAGPVRAGTRFSG